MSARVGQRCSNMPTRGIHKFGDALVAASFTEEEASGGCMSHDVASGRLAAISTGE